MSEEYDFAIYEKDLTQLAIENFIDILGSDDFKEKLETFDCYDTDACGMVVVVDGGKF